MAKLYPVFGARISTTVRFSSLTFGYDVVANFAVTNKQISYTSFEGSENPTNAQSSAGLVFTQEVEVADARRVETRIVDLAQAAGSQSKPNLAQGGVTRAEAAFVCRQPIGLIARTAGGHALSLD
jgi:hypothetical protein